MAERVETPPARRPAPLGRAIVARSAVVPAGHRRRRGRGRRLPRPPADGLAAARGRDARAVRRPGLARRDARAGHARAWRRAAALRDRLGRRTCRSRARRPPSRLGRRSQLRACPSSRSSGRRLVGPTAGLGAAALVATSWALLFHGVYARMYALFLFVSLAALLALLRALDEDRRLWWTVWAVAVLLCVATHPYGVLVLGGQVAFVLLARRERWRPAAIATARSPCRHPVLALGPRARRPVRRRGRRRRREALRPVVDRPVPLEDGRRLQRRVATRARDRAGVRAHRARRVPARGQAAGPGDTRRARSPRSSPPASAGRPHPSRATSSSRCRCSRSSRQPGSSASTRRLPAVAPLVMVALVVAQVSWAWHRTPPLFEWEPDERQATRADAEAFLAATSRPDDVLFGYEPLYLGAWERNRGFPGARAASRRRRARAAEAPQGRARRRARSRCLGARRERAQQPPPAARDRRARPGPARESSTRGPSARSSSSAPASRCARPTPTSLPRRARCCSASRSVSATPTSTCSRSSAPSVSNRGYAASSWLRSSHSR